MKNHPIRRQSRHRRNSSFLKKGQQKLYGRDEEVRILRSVLREASEEPAADEHASNASNTVSTTADNAVRVVLVEGRSGVGKTCLVEYAFWKDIPTTGLSRSSKCLLGCGKFELTMLARPLGPLFQALGQMATIISDDDDMMTKKHYIDSIHSAFNEPELVKLVQLIPELANFLYDGELTGSISEQNNEHCGVSKTELEKLKYMVRVFLKCIAMKGRPVVLYMDDVQWADTMTLEVLQMTLLDNDLRHFVLVISYRDDEVYDFTSKEKHKVAVWVESLERTSKGKGITRMTIDNLNASQIQGMLVDVLRTDSDSADTEELARFLVDRTGGNTFHVLQMLGYWKRQGLMEYSLFHWKWDLARLREESMVTSNIAELLRAKMETLSSLELELLKQCACFGYQFDQTVVPVIVSCALRNITKQNAESNMMDEYSDDGQYYDEEDLIEQYFGAFFLKGLLERVSNTTLKFVHDKIHQAALDQISTATERAWTDLQLGMALYERFLQNTDEQEYDAVQTPIFLCVDRLNSGLRAATTPSIEFLNKLCRLNHRACQSTAALGAFEHAIVYSRNAVGLLKQFSPSTWRDEYELTHSIYTLYARVCLCNGSKYDHELVDTVQEIRQHAKRWEDSFEANLTLLGYFKDRSKFHEAVTESYNILNGLDETLPYQPSTELALRMYKTTCRTLARMSDEEILNLPSIESYPKKEACIQIMETVFLPLHQRGSPRLRMVFACRMVDLTLQYGLGQYSAAAFGSFSELCLSEHFETKLATRTVELASRMLDKFGAPSSSFAAALRNKFYSKFVWHKPLSMAVDYHMETHRIGLRSGDLFTAFIAIVIYGSDYYYSGLALRPLVADSTRFLQQMYDYGQKAAIFLQLSMYQCVLNLTVSNNSKVTNGSSTVAPCPGETIFDIGGGSSKAWRKLLDWNGESGAQSDKSYCLQLAIFGRNFPLAVEMKDQLISSEKGRSHVGLYGSYYFGVARAFYICLVDYWQAKKCSKLNLMKRRRHLKEAKVYHDLMREWVVEKGSINLPQKLFLLDAEELSLTKSNSKVANASLKAAYEKAIVASVRSGFTQDAALAAYLASEALSKEREEYWHRARGFYLQWGAFALVDVLDGARHENSGSLEFGEVQGVDDMGFRARPRFEEMEEQQNHSTELKLLGSSQPHALLFNSSDVGDDVAIEHEPA